MAHILVMDDDSVTRVFLGDVLGKLFNHTVHAAASVEEALDAAVRAPMDLMFLDQNLPDGTAVEFCETLAQAPGRRTVPKWLVTGEKPLRWDAAFWRGFDVRGCLIKPFRIDQIERILQECLPSNP
jgi:CheY-like chemotaxis protein